MCKLIVYAFFCLSLQVAMFFDFLRVILVFMLSTQRTAADQILRDLQNNPDMWLQVVHILQNTKSLNTKFFALQVILIVSYIYLNATYIYVCTYAYISL